MSDSKTSPHYVVTLQKEQEGCFEDDFLPGYSQLNGQETSLLSPNISKDLNLNGDNLRHSHATTTLEPNNSDTSNVQTGTGCASKAGLKIKDFFGDWCVPSHWKFQLAIAVIIVIEIGVIVLLYHNKHSGSGVGEPGPPQPEPGRVDVDQAPAPLGMEDNPGDQQEKNPRLAFYNKHHGKNQNSPNEYVVIDDHFKLPQISTGTHTVTVTKLVSDVSAAGISKSGRDGVRHLILSGPISLPWLHLLLKSFTNLETLRVDVDEIGASIEKEKRSPSFKRLASISLPRLDKIFVDSALKYSIFDWGFDLNLTCLKTVVVTKANLDDDKFKSFTKLLSKTAKSIEEISISDSSICSSCDVTELQFENLRNLNITRRHEEGSGASIKMEQIKKSERVMMLPTIISEEYETVSGEDNGEHYDYEWKK